MLQDPATQSASGKNASPADNTYNPLYLRGIAEFNQRDFFASHETWEQLWVATRGPSRQFYQGLIQAAVAFHHLTRGNTRGANKLLSGCQQYLQSYRPTHLGLDVDAFLGEIRRCRCEAFADVADPVNPAIDPARIPKIRLRGQA